MKPRRQITILIAIITWVMIPIAAEEMARPQPSPIFIHPEPRPPPLTWNQYGKGVGLAVLATTVPVVLGYSASMMGHDNGNDLAAWLIVAGVLVGPSAGQFYHGYLGHGLAATGLRTLGAGIVLVTVVSTLVHDLRGMDCIPDEPSRNCDTDPSDPEGGIAIGIMVYAFGVTYSLVQPLLRVRNSPRKQPEQISQGTTTSVLFPQTLSPVFIPDWRGRLKMGLKAGWFF